jgi:phage baseplate assembly protein gpV
MFNTINDAMALREGLDGAYIIGTVTNNTDPLGLDRIQVTIPNLYAAEDDRPWVGPFKSSPFGIGSSWGVYGSPAVGSQVVILFQSGNPNYPAYIGGIQAKADPDFPSGTSWGFKDPKGNKLKIDLAASTVAFTAASGASILLDSSGNAKVVSPTVTIQGNLAITGNLSVDGGVTNKGVNIGSTHKHGGVAAGGSTTSTPQ